VAVSRSKEENRENLNYKNKKERKVESSFYHCMKVSSIGLDERRSSLVFYIRFRSLNY